MDYRMLGPLEVWDGSQLLSLPAEKPRAVLAILLLRANEVVSTDRLAEELWGEDPPPSAAHLVHVYVSQLRKALGAGGRSLATRSPGYVLTVGPGDLDVFRFERLLREARESFGVGDVANSERKAADAMALWRGQALADFAYETFAQAAAIRLAELRLVAVELRLEALLALGRHREVVPELEPLVAEHPLREQLCNLLMLALFRSGRQADALAAYQRLRHRLAEDLGLDPGSALRELEGAMLRHEPALDFGSATAETPEAEVMSSGRSVLVYTRDERRLDALLAIAEPLVRQPSRELLLVSVPADESDLGRVTAALHEWRAILASRGLAVRAAALTSPDPGAEVGRLASRYSADVVLADAPAGWPWAASAADLDGLLDESSSDVALLVSAEGEGTGGPVYVLFGGAEEDWAAVELAAWIARSAGNPLRLVGTAAEPDRGRRDASGLLAHASLVIQQVAGVAAEPVLASRDVDEVVGAMAGGRLVAIGLSPRRRQGSEGSFGAHVAAAAQLPVLLVRGGLRPGGLAPAESLTHFTWTVARTGA